MAVANLDAVVSGYVVEGAAAELGKNLASDFHGAEAPPSQLPAG